MEVAPKAPTMASLHLVNSCLGVKELSKSDDIIRGVQFTFRFDALTQEKIYRICSQGCINYCKACNRNDSFN